ncbi:hypothetical protein M0804_008380 [Polistes exclamans]|nr:hypothetical protein M0804_008380 [Polistes exclamans]
MQSGRTPWPIMPTSITLGITNAYEQKQVVRRNKEVVEVEEEEDEEEEEQEQEEQEEHEEEEEEGSIKEVRSNRRFNRIACRRHCVFCDIL